MMEKQALSDNSAGKQALSDTELASLHQQVKQDLQAFKEEAGGLALAFESAAKHMPVYWKIVKGHIDQLKKVLESVAHNQRKLENVGLAEPVLQLMQLFRDLDEEDIQLLEALSTEAKNWAPAESQERLVNEPALSIASEA